MSYPAIVSETAAKDEAARAMLAALETIADFAVGYGDVCEIIADRARKAIAQAKAAGIGE